MARATRLEASCRGWMWARSRLPYVAFEAGTALLVTRRGATNVAVERNVVEDVRHLDRIFH